jgi:IclR family transcriptional regulator, KDG regulon repressor
MTKKTSPEKKIPQSSLSKSIIKGFQIIELLSELEELSITELSQQLQMNKSSVYRMLATLVECNYAEKNPFSKKYSLTSKLFEIGSRSRGLVTLEEAADSVMEKLADETHETVNLAILDKGEAVYIKKIESPQPLRMDLPVGTRLPPNCTSLGKVLIAYLPKDALKTLMDGTTFVKKTSKSIMDLRKLRGELAKVRESGYAIDDEEFSLGIRCASAPVWGADHTVVAALSISGPSLRLSDRDLKRMARLVIEGSQEINRNLTKKAVN